MRTLLSDDGSYVLVFHDDDSEPEEFELVDFIAVYGEDALGSEALRTNDGRLKTNVEPMGFQQEDVKRYYEAFQRLVDLCGDYEHKRKMLENINDGASTVRAVARSYYGLEPNKELADIVRSLKRLCEMAVFDLDYWSRRVGYKPMSTPKDVKFSKSGRRADTENLLHHLEGKDFRKRLKYRIKKYVKKGELKSATELFREVFISYKKGGRRSS